MQFVSLPRTTIIIRGKDRAPFLHSFCTQEIKRLVPGQAREAFVLDLRGKVLGHIHVLIGDDLIEVNSVANQAAMLIAHWERYVIREDVCFEDCSDLRQHLFVFGSELYAWAASFGRPLPTRSHQVIHWRYEFGEDIWAAAGDFAGPGMLLGMPRDATDRVQACLADIPCATDEEFTAHRIEHRFPQFGVDAFNDALPQELRRDKQAIAFDKGCYLGQETVARLDALGHVNRLLVRIKLDGPTPAVGAILRDSQDREVGRLTSVAWSARLRSAIALAIVRRQAAAPTTRLMCDHQPAIVEDPVFPELEE